MSENTSAVIAENKEVKRIPLVQDFSVILKSHGIARVIRSLSETAYKDPSLVTDSLLYKGVPQLTRMPLGKLR